MFHNMSSEKAICPNIVCVFVLPCELFLQMAWDVHRTALLRTDSYSPSCHHYLGHQHPHLPSPEETSLSCHPYFWLPSTDKTVKLWKVSERDKRPEGYNLKDEEGRLRDPATITTLRVSGLAVPAMPFGSLGYQGQGNAPLKLGTCWPQQQITAIICG